MEGSVWYDDAMDEIWQLYDEEGNPLPGKGALWHDVYKGLLCGAAHVWIWRESKGKVEILLQKRAAVKETWPNLLDISAAGHINLGEEPLEAAVRETQEEIGVVAKPTELHLIDKMHSRMVSTNGKIVNEWRWMYSLQIAAGTEFTLQEEEVESIVWKELDTFKAEVTDQTQRKSYVPHEASYFKAVTDFIERQTQTA